VTLPYDPADPPIDLPEGCVNRLMWQLGRRLHADHQPGLDGFCLICRPYEFYPCAGRELADTGLEAAYRQPEGSPWRVQLVGADRGTDVSSVVSCEEDLHYQS
jgi:hypothetical protein